MIWYKDKKMNYWKNRIKERIRWEIEDVKSWWDRWEEFFLTIIFLISIILVVYIIWWVMYLMIK